MTLSFLPLWLPVWIFSTFGLALLAVYHHHRRRHAALSRSTIDEARAFSEPIASMKPSGGGGGGVQLAAFRAGDYLLHTLPLAAKIYLLDMPRT